MTQATLDLIESARQSRLAAREHLDAIDRERTAAMKRRQAIFDAPLPKEDFVASMAKFVRHKGDLFRQSCTQYHATPGRRMSYREALTAGTDNFLQYLIAPGNPMYAVAMEGALCLFLEEGINAGMRRIADDMKWSEDAIPMDARAALLRQVDAEIANLTAKGAALAEALGLGAYPFLQPEISGAMPAPFEATPESVEASNIARAARNAAEYAKANVHPDNIRP